MGRAINIGSESFMLSCKYCNRDYDLIAIKRRTNKTEPIRCPHCNCIVAK